MNLYLQFILFTLAGWVNRHQQAVIEYLQAENQALREQLGKKRIRWTDAQRRRLAEKAKAVGRSALAKLGTIVTPDTLLRWYHNLVAAKYDGSKQRGPGRPPTKQDITELIVRMASENLGLHAAPRRTAQSEPRSSAQYYQEHPACPWTRTRARTRASHELAHLHQVSSWSNCRS